MLMQELLAGPQDETLRSTIPAGTALLSLDMEGSRALVDLSTPYGTLSGVALTLADQAITLTLTQLPDIMSVKITVRGRELAYREKQVFAARDVLLAPEGDVVSTVDVMLTRRCRSGCARRRRPIPALWRSGRRWRSMCCCRWRRNWACPSAFWT